MSLQKEVVVTLNSIAINYTAGDSQLAKGMSDLILEREGSPFAIHRILLVLSKVVMNIETDLIPWYNRICFVFGPMHSKSMQPAA